MLERLLRNGPMKLLALALAFMIWVAVTGDKPILRDYSVPLEIQLAADRTPTAPPPTNVTVRLEGPAPLLRRLDPLRLAVRLDLRNAQVGKRDVQLQATQLAGVPKGATVAFFDPDRIHLEVGRKLQRELPIVAELSGDPASDHSVYRVVLRPDRLVVEGPESAVSILERLATVPIELDGRSRTFDTEVEVNPGGPMVRVLDGTGITARVIVDQAPGERRFDAIPVDAVGAAPLASGRLIPDSVRVTVAGPPALLARLEPGQIRAVVGVADLPRGRRTGGVAVQTSLGEMTAEQQWRLNVTSVEPGEVTVEMGSEGPDR